MGTWYNRLLATLEISGTGIVAEKLRTVLNSRAFQNLPVIKELDPVLSSDVTVWFTSVFNPWFAQLSGTLTVGNSQEELTSISYANHINKIILALLVARSYYAKVADGEYMTSLKNEGQYKAAICEEIAKSVGYAFEQALLQFGSRLEGRSIEITVASEYKGSTPEKFSWNGNVLVNHVKYEDIKIMADTTENQNPNGNCNGSKQYLPWSFLRRIRAYRLGISRKRIKSATTVNK